MTDKSSNPASSDISGSEFWATSQLNEAHKLLDDMGVPDRTVRPDYNRGKGQVEDKEFSLGVPERIQWLRAKIPAGAVCSSDSSARAVK